MQVQGRLHPRSQQAMRRHAELLEALLAPEARQRVSVDDQGGEARERGHAAKSKVEDVFDEAGQKCYRALMSLGEAEGGGGGGGGPRGGGGGGGGGFKT
jgi:hypothetical protein